MGLFDLASPLLSLLDGLISFIPAGLRIILWGVFSSALTMGVYWWSSPQEKIGAIKARAIDARKKLAAYDGAEFDEMWPLARDMLSMSGKHFMSVTGPAIIGSLPVLFILVWMSNDYGYRLPDAGVSIKLNAYPDAEAVRWPVDSRLNQDGSHTLVWPAQAFALTDTDGNTLFDLPLPAAVPVVEQRFWWNSLFGNPAGYLDTSTSIQTVTIDLPKQSFFEIGPSWLHGWEAPYFIVLIICSLAIKFRFDIH